MRAEDIAGQFALNGEIISATPYGNGHINDTYLVCTKTKEGEERYILQRINTSIFTNPAELMENILGVTGHIRKKIAAAGGDVNRGTLTVIPAKDGRNYCEVPEAGCYRVYAYIADTKGLDVIETSEDFYASGEAFGNFGYLLADYPADTLHETIPNFHNTRMRYERFLEVVAENPLGRAAGVQKEIDFIKERAEDMPVLHEMILRGELPLRVTHNDTKSNNILLDKKTGEGLCVIDLDTVMPGSALYDFGDSIRFGASTAEEDEQNLDRVEMSLELFECYTKGFIAGFKGMLTPQEIKMLPMGAKMMTMECGIRFLADYIEGDVYFKIHRDGQNLDRARTQLKLVWDMEQKWERMAEIVAEYV